MGIQGLLPALRDVTRQQHVSAYSGHAVAVDAYCWLHRGAYSCSREMCEDLPTDGCVGCWRGASRRGGKKETETTIAFCSLVFFLGLCRRFLSELECAVFENALYTCFALRLKLA